MSLIYTPKKFNSETPVSHCIYHWTASPYNPKNEFGADHSRIKRWLKDEDRKSSTHFIIMRDGELIQAASLWDRTWHAGGSKIQVSDNAFVRNVNSRSIGIDMENVGPLFNESGEMRNSYGGRHHGGHVEAEDGFYEPYSDAQLSTLLNLINHLCDIFPLLRKESAHLGHCDVKSTKSDPGPLFPMAHVRQIAGGFNASYS